MATAQATSQDVLLAVLALDAYNQGYSPGMQLANKTLVDGATIIANSSKLLGPIADDASFYAIAYNVSGQTVIAYRGTRAPGGIPDLGDVMNGWTLSAGFAQASQAQFAMQFYTDVTRAPVSRLSAQPANVVLTGHSLGGGLAGFIADDL
jgi:hypothetical protein